MTSYDSEQVQVVLRERWASELGLDSLKVSATEHRKRLCLRVCIDSSDERHRWIMEAGVSRPGTTREEPAARQLVLEFLDAFISEWFAERREVRLSLNFRAHDFSGQQVFLRGRRRDLRADRMAAQLLGEPMEPDLEEID